MSLTALARRPLVLLAPAGGALLMLGVLGPTLRGAAAAILATAGGLALGARSRATAASAGPRPLRVLERVQLGPRQVLVLVETAGRRYLVATGAAIASLPPGEQP